MLISSYSDFFLHSCHVDGNSQGVCHFLLHHWSQKVVTIAAFFFWCYVNAAFEQSTATVARLCMWMTCLCTFSAMEKDTHRSIGCALGIISVSGYSRLLCMMHANLLPVIWGAISTFVHQKCLPISLVCLYLSLSF